MTLKNVSDFTLDDLSNFMLDLDKLMATYCHVTEFLPKMFYNGVNVAYDTIHKEYARREKLQDEELED